LLSRVLHIEETDHPAQLRAKLEAGAAALLGPDEDALPLFLHLYHLEQASGVVIEREAFQGRLLALMRRVLAALAAQRPSVVCLQDLHWADPSTVALVAQLTDLASPLLLLVNYRPGYTPPPGMQVLNLQELSPRQTGELLASLLQGEPPAPLVGFVTERSDGNPFYVEEVVNALVETGVLARQAERWVLTKPLAEAAVPATIRGVLAARIDRLDEARRRLLRLASVVGREFVVTIIARVGEDGDELTPGLAQLQAADLIRQRRLEPELEYMFKSMH
jgi:predicted ATPase